MRKELGMGYCGLVCALCSENINCVGCKNKGCKDKETCKCFICCTQKGYDSCAECKDFPCEDSILSKPRIRTFCKFRKEFGEDVLLQCLENNEKQGIQYHYPNEIIGDYDTCESEEELYQRLFHAL